MKPTTGPRRPRKATRRRLARQKDWASEEAQSGQSADPKFQHFKETIRFERFFCLLIVH